MISEQHQGVTTRKTVRQALENNKEGRTNTRIPCQLIADSLLASALLIFPLYH